MAVDSSAPTRERSLTRQTISAPGAYGPGRLGDPGSPGVDSVPALSSLVPGVRGGSEEEDHAGQRNGEVDPAVVVEEDAQPLPVDDSERHPEDGPQTGRDGHAGREHAAVGNREQARRDRDRDPKAEDVTAEDDR